MKAFLLAAGFGTRLHPVHAVHTQVLPGSSLAMVQIWLELCARLRDLRGPGEHARPFGGGNSFRQNWHNGVAVAVVEEPYV
jgi:hypothetical protein